MPKAYVLLIAGAERTPETALSIFKLLHTRLAPFKRTRRVELVTELPKTIQERSAACSCAALSTTTIAATPLRGQEFREDEFPELQKVRTAGSEHL